MILCRCIDVHFSNVYKKLLECSTDISGFFLCDILCRCIDVHFSNVYKKLLECSTDISGFFLCSAFVHKVH